MPFSSVVSKPPPPASALGRLRVLSRRAGIRSSPLFFGGISVGTAWHEYTSPSDKAASFELLDTFVRAGGVSIDTASGYSDEQSEMWIGEWMKARGNRDQLVIATKYTTDFRSYALGKNEVANMCGNSRKSLHVSLHASLRKLQTEYVDILYVHWWDWTTTIQEMMDGLDAYVKQGKVLYLGASNLPAWVVSACNEYAMSKSQAQFVVYQGRWNILDRDIEQDVLPVCRMYGMAVVSWSSLGTGRFKNEKDACIDVENKLTKQLERCITHGELQADSLEVQASRTLLRIAQKHKMDSFAPVALAWLFAKYPMTFPIVGFHNELQLRDNVQALDLKLEPEDIALLDALAPPKVKAPYDMCGLDPNATGALEGNNALQLGTIDWLVQRDTYQSQL